MHYIESGSGPPLLLLHAFPVDARMWNRTRSELDPDARVITPDQRGLGQSAPDGSPVRELATRQDPPEQPGLDQVAADVIALLDKLELSRVVLGGCSMGGYVAMAVLRAAPERVSGLVLSDTKADADTEDQRQNRLNAADRAEREGTRGWLADNAVNGLLGATTRNERPEICAEVRSLVEEQPADGVAWAQRAMAARPDSSRTLRGFDGTALVVVGEEDATTPPEAARDLTALLPHGELAILPGAGHLPAIETPDAFADTVRRWMSSLS